MAAVVVLMVINISHMLETQCKHGENSKLIFRIRKLDTKKIQLAFLLILSFPSSTILSCCWLSLECDFGLRGYIILLLSFCTEETNKH